MMGSVPIAERMPVLRFVPVEALIPHEQADRMRTEPLAERLRTEGVLKNPPVVTPIPDELRYVVLDGANRVAAARRLGVHWNTLRHRVARLEAMLGARVDDPELRLRIQLAVLWEKFAAWPEKLPSPAAE
ncbi:MAG: hypothetical protein C4303_07905 [candidate division GAL15 bacterium]